MNSEFIHFQFLLKLYAGDRLWYSFPCRNREEAKFLAAHWMKSNKYGSLGKLRATLSKLDLPIRNEWLAKVTLERYLPNIGREGHTERWTFWCLSISQARLLREWFGVLTVDLQRSPRQRMEPWIVNFVEEHEEMPF